MSDNQLTRRTLLQRGAGAAGFVTLGSLAGCGGDDSSGNGNGNAPGSGQIPAAAQAMVQVDVQGMLSDQNVRDVVNKFLEEASAQGGYTGPTTLEEILSTAEGMGEVDPQGFNSMTMFMKTDGQDAVENYLGMIMETDWTAQELIDSAGGLGADVEEGSYQGVTTYTSAGDDSMAADLGGGTFVLGTENATTDAIDVSTGNGQSLSGDLANYFDQTSGGYMRFASMIPEEEVPEDTQQFDIGLQNVRYVSGSFYSQGSNLGMDLNMHTTDSESASQMSESLEGILTFFGSGVEDETAQQILDQIEISASGSTVTISYTESVSQINTYIDNYATEIFGAGMGGGMTSSSA